PGAEPVVPTGLWREPRWSAGRRAVPAWTASAPRTVRTMDGLRLSALASLVSEGAESAAREGPIIATRDNCSARARCENKKACFFLSCPAKADDDNHGADRRAIGERRAAVFPNGHA